jgi:uncharacterized repeat protein (TIGR01451 family)
MPFGIYYDSNYFEYYEANEMVRANDGTFYGYFRGHDSFENGNSEKLARIGADGDFEAFINLEDEYCDSGIKHLTLANNGDILLFFDNYCGDTLTIWRYGSDLELKDVVNVPGIRFNKLERMANGNFKLYSAAYSGLKLWEVGENGNIISFIEDDSWWLFPKIDDKGGINYLSSSDGGFYVVYNTYDTDYWETNYLYVHKFDATGTKTWSTSVILNEGFPSSNRPQKLYSTIIGNSLYVNTWDKLFKISATGELEWTKENKHIASPFQIKEMTSTNSGQLLMLGINNASYQNALLHTDTFGVASYANTFNLHTSQNGYNYLKEVFSLKMLPDSTWSVFGLVEWDQLLVAKLDGSGNPYPNLVAGKVVSDTIGNCMPDVGEPGLQNIRIRARIDNFEYYLTTDELGEFRIATLSGQVVLEPQTNLLYLAACDSSYTLTIDSLNIPDTATLDIPVKVLGNCPIMNVEIVAPFYRRCFDNNAIIRYCNLGNEVAENAEMTLYFSQGFSLVSAGLPITAQDGQTVTFSLGNLQPGDCGVIPITFHIGCEVALGQTWCITAIAEPSHVCFVLPEPFQNDPPHFERDCKPVIGSFDPNDKQAQPIGLGEQHFITNDTALTYLIRFQNTGTDTAFQVVVVDTLSPLLDPLTVFPGASSHPYRFELGNGGVGRFIFEEIMLPDSNVNEAASHGYVQFKIAQRRNNAAGLRIENSAAIYFDYNEPVITNTVFHTTWDAFESYNIAVSENQCGRMELNGQFPGASYLWSNGDTTPVTTVHEPGWVHLTLTMPFGYVHHDSIYAAVQENDLQVSATLNHPRCYGSPDAGIDLQVASDPTQALVFNWNTGSNSEDLYFTVGGLYTVTVTSSNGCTKVETYELVNPPPILVEVLQTTNVSCFGGNDGQITLVGEGGTGNLSWQWSNGATISNPSNLTAGPHTWFAIDANSCFVTGTVELGVEPLPLFSTVLEDISCHGYNDGFMEVVMGEGEGNYSIIWSTGTTGDSIVNLPPGTYGYELMYGNGCVFASFGYEIVEPFPITITMEGIAPTTGQANGSINTNAIGGKPPYEYLWSTGATTNPVTNLTAGSYAVTITDKNGCTEVGTYQLESTSATGNLIALSNVLVSPNPSTNEFLLEFWLESPELFSIEAFNALGQHKQTVFPLEMHDTGKHSIKIQAFDWPSGPYLLLFSSPAGESQMKLVLKN